MRTDKIIFHVDMNAFFASVEQACNPFLQGKPVAIVPGGGVYKGAAILARSYEARDLGIKTFSRFFEAQRICPELIPIRADSLKYYDVNQRLAKIMYSYTPDYEIYSIDEFFLDLTKYFKIHKSQNIEGLAHEIKKRIADEISPVLKCSIGVGANKLLAKVGSDFKKPDGLTIISWENRHDFLDQMDLSDIWGIGRNCVPKLKKVGINSTADLRATDGKVLAQYVGGYWTRLKMIANGEHYHHVNFAVNTKPRKSMQHAHTLSTPTSDLHELYTLIRKQSERLAVRLRRHKQLAGIVQLGIRPSRQKHYGWGYAPQFWSQREMPGHTDSGMDLYHEAVKILHTFDLTGIETRLLVVGVADLISAEQGMLLDTRPPKRTQAEQAIDKVNNKYGQFTVRSADILNQRAKESELTVHRMPMTFHTD